MELPFLPQKMWKHFVKLCINLGISGQAEGLYFTFVAVLHMPIERCGKRRKGVVDVQA